MATRFREARELLDSIEALVRQPVVPPFESTPARSRLAPPVLAREQAARERKVRNEPDAELAAERKHVFFGRALEQAVLVLQRDDRRAASSAAQVGDLAQLLRGEVRAPDVACLALDDYLLHGTDGLLERRHSVGSVVVVEIHVIGAETLEGGGDRLLRVDGRAPELVRVGHQIPAELRRDHDLVAAALEDLSEKTLATAAVPVDVGGVEERNPRVESSFDDGTCLSEVEPGAEVVAPEADLRHDEVGACHAPLLHGVAP